PSAGRAVAHPDGRDRAAMLDPLWRGSLRRGRPFSRGASRPIDEAGLHQPRRHGARTVAESRGMSQDTAIRDRLIVGLDVASVDEARAVVEELGDTVSFYKIGYQLAFAGGLELARRLVADGKQVFLDMKLLDI